MQKFCMLNCLLLVKNSRMRFLLIKFCPSQPWFAQHVLLHKLIFSTVLSWLVWIINLHVFRLETASWMWVRRWSTTRWRTTSSRPASWPTGFAATCSGRDPTQVSAAVSFDWSLEVRPYCFTRPHLTGSRPSSEPPVVFKGLYWAGLKTS